MNFEDVTKYMKDGTSILNSIISFIMRVITFWDRLDWYERILVAGLVIMIGYGIWELWRHRSQIKAIKF